MYISKYNFGENYKVWDCWIGCYKVSEACANCYVKYLNSFQDIFRAFPYKNLDAGTVVSCTLKSDFFLPDADKYREMAWNEIRNNPDLIFLIITKRIDRIISCLPEDWGDGWDNVILCATIENQKRADERLPRFLSIPCKHRWLTCSPLLENIDISKYLMSGKIEHVECTGERTCTFPARPTYYEWVKNLLNQCITADVRFTMLYLGNNFIMPDGEIKQEYAQWYRCEIADSLNLLNYKPITFKLKNSTITY